MTADLRRAYCAPGGRRVSLWPIFGALLLLAVLQVCATLDRAPVAECQTDAECAALDYPQ